MRVGDSSLLALRGESCALRPMLQRWASGVASLDTALGGGLAYGRVHELYAAQGFPADYIFDRQADGTPITKTAQVQKCGNAVCPPVARAIVAVNLNERFLLENAV